MRRCADCEEEKPLTEFYEVRARGTRMARCRSCSKARVLEWQKANPEKLQALQKRYALKHRERKAASTAEWYQRNKKRNHANSAAWYRKNLARGAEKKARYLAAKLRATPAWANEFFISEAYDLASRRTKMLGYKWSVDHIVPLQSKLVCGLHVENNLRVIPASVNSVKGNRVWPDMPPVAEVNGRL